MNLLCYSSRLSQEVDFRNKYKVNSSNERSLLAFAERISLLIFLRSHSSPRHSHKTIYELESGCVESITVKKEKSEATNLINCWSPPHNETKHSRMWRHCRTNIRNFSVSGRMPGVAPSILPLISSHFHLLRYIMSQWTYISFSRASNTPNRPGVGASAAVKYSEKYYVINRNVFLSSSGIN